MSYSTYLWHLPVGRLLAKTPFPGSPGTAFLLRATSYVALSLAVGAGMSKVIEYPVLRWRDRRFPARGAAPAPVPVMAQEDRA